MRKITIELGGSEREISELPGRSSDEWRTKFEDSISPLLHAIGNVEISSAGDLAQAINDYKAMLFGSISIIRELVIEYAKLDREWVLDHAYDSEIVEAFVAIVGMAYPIDFLARRLTRTGASASPISMNGASQSTEDGQRISNQSN